MKLNVYTIFDVAAGAYTRPFYCQSDGQATRMFTDLACDADHEVGKHPEDYSLYRVASWNDNTAEFIPERKECLATALECISNSRQINGGDLLDFDKGAKSA